MTGAGAMLLVGAFSARKVIQETKGHVDKHKYTRGLELIFGIQVASFAYSKIETDLSYAPAVPTCFHDGYYLLVCLEPSS
jgi:hypothetical protein